MQDQTYIEWSDSEISDYTAWSDSEIWDYSYTDWSDQTTLTRIEAIQKQQFASY
jgi:hypothetical protein